MEGQLILFMVTLGAVILLIACAVRGNMERLVTLLMRGFLGAVGIHFANGFLAGMGIGLGIGINIVSLLATAILGIPGFLGLYVLGIYRLM